MFNDSYHSPETRYPSYQEVAQRIHQHEREQAWMLAEFAAESRARKQGQSSFLKRVIHLIGALHLV